MSEERFLLFTFDAYEASGGWNDFLSAFSSQHAAEETGRRLLASASSPYFAQVVSTTTLSIVWEGELTWRECDESNSLQKHIEERRG